MRPLREQVVVITGASSGIGRATALEFGRRGDAQFLVQRRGIVALSLTSIGAMGLLALDQIGIIKHLPDPTCPM